MGRQVNANEKVKNKEQIKSNLPAKETAGYKSEKKKQEKETTNGRVTRIHESCGTKSNETQFTLSHSHWYICTFVHLYIWTCNEGMREGSGKNSYKRTREKESEKESANKCESKEKSNSVTKNKQVMKARSEQMNWTQKSNPATIMQ